MISALEQIGQVYNPDIFQDLLPYKSILRDNIVVDIYSRDIDCDEGIMSMSLYNPNQIFRHPREVADFSKLRAMFEIYARLIGTRYSDIESVREVFLSYNISVDELVISRTNDRLTFHDMVYRMNRYKILVNCGGFICRILRG